MWIGYLEHLTDRDLTLLATLAGHESVEDLLAELREDPGGLDRILQQPALFDLLFEDGAEVFLRASPFLAFAVLTHRTARDLDQVRYVEEWISPGRRVPTFAVGELREFLGDDSRKLYLAELLASYTRVTSGSYWVRTARGWRRRRFSELDPIRLLELLETLPASDRPAVYRRLGDLVLFLTGVFPDYAAGRFLPGSRGPRLQRHLRLSETRMDSGWPAGSSGDMGLLEQIGSRSYQLAWEGTEGIGTARVIGELSESFGQARRLLNFLTHRYLFPHREEWFPLG